MLFNTDNCIQHHSFICTQLNGSKYCDLSLTIELIISHSFTHKGSNSSISNNSIYPTSFVCTQFKCQTVLFDPKTGPYQVLSLLVRVDQGAMAMKGYSIFLKALEPYHQIVWGGVYSSTDIGWGKKGLRPGRSGGGKKINPKEKGRGKGLTPRKKEWKKGLRPKWREKKKRLTTKSGGEKGLTQSRG